MPLGDILVIQQIAYKEELNEIDEEIDLEVSTEERIEGKGFLNLIPEAKIDDLEDQYQKDLEKLLSGKPKKVSVPGKPKKKESLFGLSPDQLKKAEAELQTVKKAVKETTAEEVDQAIKTKTDKTETVKTKKGGKKNKWAYHTLFLLK